MFTVSIMHDGHYVNHTFTEKQVSKGSWVELVGMLRSWARSSSDGLASFDTNTTRHNVWTHPECTGGLEATIDSQSF